MFPGDLPTFRTEVLLPCHHFPELVFRVTTSDMEVLFSYPGLLMILTTMPHLSIPHLKPSELVRNTPYCSEYYVDYSLTEIPFCSIKIRRHCIQILLFSLNKLELIFYKHCLKKKGVWAVLIILRIKDTVLNQYEIKKTDDQASNQI